MSLRVYSFSYHLLFSLFFLSFLFFFFSVFFRSRVREREPSLDLRVAHPFSPKARLQPQAGRPKNQPRSDRTLASLFPTPRSLLVPSAARETASLDPPLLDPHLPLARSLIPLPPPHRLGARRAPPLQAGAPSTTSPPSRPGGHQQGPTPADVVLRRPSPARSAKPPWLHLLHRPNPSSSTPSSSVAPRALKCLVPRRRPSSRSSAALLPRPRRRFPTPLGAAPAALSIEQDQERHEDARLDRAWAAFSPWLLTQGPRGPMPASPRSSFASSSGPAPADLLKFTT